LSTASVAVPAAFRYIFWGSPGDRRKGAVMDWARILTCVTGTVDQELLARNEYLATENPILEDQLKGRLMLSDAEGATLGEIGHRLGRKVLAEVATVARSDTILAWYRKLVARKFSGSHARQGPGRPRLKRSGGATDHLHGEREPGLRLRPDRGRHGQSRVCDFRSDGWQCSAAERRATRAGAQARDPMVGLHPNPLGAGGPSWIGHACWPTSLGRWTKNCWRGMNI
jgi:hypothetical protein